MRPRTVSLIAAGSMLLVAAVHGACEPGAIDTRTTDAAVEVASPPPPRERTPLDAGGFCPPAPVDPNRRPFWEVPRQREAVCTEREIFTLLNCTLRPDAAGVPCEGKLDESAPDGGTLDGGVPPACIACALTRVEGHPEGKPLGALLLDEASLRLNRGGCILLERLAAARDGDSSGTEDDLKCALAVEEEDQCLTAACRGCRARGIDAFESCRTAAQETVPTCANARDKRGGECGNRLETVPAVCTPGANFYQSAHDLAMHWCGPDAG